MGQSEERTLPITFISPCEFVSGWASGICGVVTGHPLDTVKVRMQVSQDKSLVGNVRSTFRYEGVRGFYKGLVFPVLSAGVLNAIFFGVYGNCLRHLSNGQKRTLCCEDDAKVDYVERNALWHCKVAFAGLLGGIARCVLIGCPVECVKTKLQGNRKSQPGPWKVAQQIIRRRGIRGLYCGFAPMLFRDGPGFAVYIVTYEHMICSMEGSLKLGEPRRYSSEIISGGLAGCFSWIIAMPFDLVKSRMQWDDPNKPKYKGMIDCFRQSYNEGGYRMLTKGLGAACLRSFPVNAVTFVVYQMCMQNCSDFVKS